LSHANVVQVFDLGRADDRLFIAMEYVEGFDLNDLLGRCSRARVPLPFELAVHVVREALRGLDYAHRRMDDEGKPLGIVHRDVSPSNLLVSFEGEVKVCDFGIAHANDALAEGRSAHELDEAIRGKAGYMSPEHAGGQPIDARSDVFAAGIVLWELASGRRLYRAGDGRDSLLEQAKRGEVPALPAHGLPEAEQLRAIAGKALAREPGDRYPSAAAMLRDLEVYAASARLMTSPLQLGDWLEKTLGEDILEKRRARERAAAALEKGAPLVVQAIAPLAPANGEAPRLDVAPVSTKAPVESSPPKRVTPDAATQKPLRRGRPAALAALVFVVLAVAGAVELALHAR